MAPDARYRVDHGITIRAPARAVWPWLVQLGQDRGGFYSYDWLIVRTRGAGTPTFTGLVFGPFNVFMFEPAHFIMQRGMLRGIRDRAERL